MGAGNMSHDEKKPQPVSPALSSTGSSGSSSGSSSNPPSTPSSNGVISDFKAIVDARLTEVKAKLHHVCTEIYDRMVGNTMAVHTRKVHMWSMDPTKYEIRSCIGRGGVGDVFLAYNPETETECALKTITINAYNSQQLIDELRILNKLRDIHVIRLNSAFLMDDVLCIVLPYMYSLRRVAHVHIANKDPLTPAFANEQLIEILYQILSGLSFMHEKQFVHRDLKCDNILINRDGCVKISDLGLTTMIKQNFKPENGKWERVMKPVGTAGYMAPEVVRHLFDDSQPGGAPYDFTCDIWSFGMCIAELILADNPFYNMDDDTVQRAVLEWPKFRLRKLHPEGSAMEGKCARDVLDLMKLCLRKDPEMRPSASALLSGHGLFKDKNKPDFIFASKSIIPKEVRKKIRQMEYIDAERDEKLKRLKLSFCVHKAGANLGSRKQFEVYQMPNKENQLFSFDESPGNQKALLVRIILRHKIKDYLMSREIPLGLNVPQRQLEIVLRQALFEIVQSQAIDVEDYIKTCREAITFINDVVESNSYLQYRFVHYTGEVIQHRLQRCCVIESLGIVYGNDFASVGAHFMKNSRKRFDDIDISMNNC